MLAQKLLEAGAVPQHSRTDAEYIALATVHSTNYLVSWNHKHIVHANKLEQIKQVCQSAGFRPVIICTPIELMEELQMKETPAKHAEPDFDPEIYTNSILEECYRIKDEINAQFKTIEELSAYLKAGKEEDKRHGIKYVSFFEPAKHTPPEKSDDDT